VRGSPDPAPCRTLLLRPPVIHAQPGRTPRRRTSLPKLIEEYYADLARQKVLFEMGTRTAFFALLHAAGKEHGWTLIAEQESG